MRQAVIAGNWKMYKSGAEAREWLEKFRPLVLNAFHCEIVVAPAFTALHAAVEGARGSAVTIAAQNGYWEAQGAFTGEVSMNMLVEAGCQSVILGHSERRQFFGETDATVGKRVKAALAAGLRPIVCVGELLAEREEGRQEEVLKRQFEGALAALTREEFSRILLAYEPVWAIGTGRTATAEIASQAHRYLRGLTAERFSPEQASQVRILYGGSVKPENIRGLMAQQDIDGALVGGASLDAEQFAGIVNYT